MQKLLGLLIVVSFCTLAIGCGRKGPLEAPSSVEDNASQQKKSDGLEEFATKRTKRNQPIEIPHQAFILDPLL